MPRQQEPTRREYAGGKEPGFRRIRPFSRNARGCWNAARGPTALQQAAAATRECVPGCEPEVQDRFVLRSRATQLRFSVKLLRLSAFVSFLTLAAADASPQERARPWEVPMSLRGLSFQTTSEWVASRDAQGAREGECRGERRCFVGYLRAPAYEIKGPGWSGLRADILPIRSGSRDGHRSRARPCGS